MDAYPLVDAAKVGRRRTSLKDYVLVDPAAGLESVTAWWTTASARASWASTGSLVELAFSQRFRQLKDGATFEQAFTGYTAEQPRLQRGRASSRTYFRASGVLGLALRRYGEGEGFQAQQLGPGTAVFRPSVPRLVPNTGTVEELTAAYWNVAARHEADSLADLPAGEAGRGSARNCRQLGIDLVAVVKAGIESWNTAFGFPVLEARLADAGDSFADDDKNYFIWDAEPARGLRLRRLAGEPQHRRDPRGQRLLPRRRSSTSALDAFEPDAPAGPGEAPPACARPATAARAGLAALPQPAAVQPGTLAAGQAARAAAAR